MRDLTLDDIDEQKRGDVFIQEYSAKPKIEGVKIIPIKNFVGEDGDFSELVRLNDGEVEGMDGFKVAQVNRSRLFSGGIKAWHLHFGQDDVWYLPPSDSLLIGLWDLRKETESSGVTMKFTLGLGQSNLLFIPRGVAHGMTNVSGEPIDLYYFVNQQFNPESPDERRLPWDALGADFWQPARE